MEFREVLQQTRKARGWSQEDLAEKIQVSRQAVSKWETGDAMPDLPKLLALADALELSLDALCGREVPVADSAPSAAEPSTAPKSHSSTGHSLPVWMLLCGLLAVCLIVTGLWAWSRRNWVPAEEAPAQTILPDTFTVTGVGFVGESDYRVKYQFTPGVTGEGLTYQITFTYGDGKSITLDAPCTGGVCTDTAVLDGGWGSYTVTASVTDGTSSRNVAIANGLSFHEGSASWTPLE